MILLALLPLSFCLSAIESALLSVSRVRVRYHASSAVRTADKLAILLSRKEQVVTSVTVLNHLVNLAAFALIIRFLVLEFGTVGYLAAFLGALPIYLIGLEVAPKAIAQRTPFRLLITLFPLANLANMLLGPAINLGRFFSPWLIKVDQSIASSEDRLRQEFKTITREITKSGALGKVENRMIQRLIESRDISASDAMIPLSQVTAVPLTMPVRTLLNLASETRYDQFPVMGLSGSFVGTIDVFDTLLSVDLHGRVGDYIKKLPTFPTTAGISEILYQLRRGGWEIAEIADENGDPLGITSAEDLLAIILGEREQREFSAYSPPSDLGCQPD